MSTKILLIDIETAPSLGYVWGLWNNNVSLNQLVRDGYVLNWSAAWVGDDYVYSDALHYHKLWKTDPENDVEILKSIWSLLDQADIVVAHNADRFDVPTLNARFIRHGMRPPSTYRTVDTLKIARTFRFISNKLEWLGKILTSQSKLETGGFDLWKSVMNGDVAAFDKMVEYCEQDVLLLEQVYLKLRPWDKKHPAMVVDGPLDNIKCNVCSSTKINKNGSYSTNTQTYQKYQCSECGHNMRSRFAIKRTKDEKTKLLRSI